MGIKCLSQGHTDWNLYKIDSRIKISGGGTEIRTLDLLLESPTCSQENGQVHNARSILYTGIQHYTRAIVLSLFGGEDGTVVSELVFRSNGWRFELH